MSELGKKMFTGILSGTILFMSGIILYTAPMTKNVSCGTVLSESVSGFAKNFDDFAAKIFFPNEKSHP